MPVPKLYQRSIEREGITSARLQAGDFGESGLAHGLQSAGRALGQYAQAKDEIEDVKAKVEANRLLVEHSEATRAIGNGVKQTLGEGAEAAAEGGITELEKATKDILGRASPRARAMLEPQLLQRDVVSKDSFLDHGFGEKVKAFDSTAVAANQAMLEEAADEPDEDKALTLLKPITEKNAERARFYGHGRDWEVQENRRYISAFFKSRALKLAIGESGSAAAAIEYATAHRKHLEDDDYLAIVQAYNNGALDEIATDMVYGGGRPSATVNGGQAPVGAVAEGPTRALDPKAFFKAFISPAEGSKLVTDSNGAAVKYGVNAEYHPGENIAGMTEDRAAEIFKRDYFIESGADKLPPGLAAIHADTYWLNKSAAKKILKESGGDQDRYIELRGQFLDGLAEKNPAKFGRYKAGWRNRTAALAQFAARQGGDGTPLDISAATSMEAVTQGVMARTDIGLALKQRIIKTVEGRRNDIIQERNFRESEAQRSLTSAALALGDKFTDLKQLPQSALLAASPATLSTFTEMAKGNKENRPLSPELATYINFVEVADPKKFASKEFLAEITNKGAPLSTIRTVAARQGEVAGHLVNPTKVDPVADGSLWAIAKEPFEAAGLLLDTTEAKGGKKQSERQADAAVKGQAISYLRGQMTSWMAANPGKKPDDATIRGWVGWSLLKSNGVRAFQMTDEQTYMAIPQHQRVRIIRNLYGSGPRPPSPQLIRDVVAVHRDFVARQGGLSGR